MFDPRPHLITLPRRVKDPGTGHWVTRHEVYLPVRARVMAFREQYPQGTLETKPLTIDVERGFACFEATATTGDSGRAVGHGSETRATFEDFIERSETRAVGRCLGLLGFGTEYALEVDELPHVADAPVASTNGPVDTLVSEPLGEGSTDHVPPEARITRDQARELKKAAQATFGFAAGERQLREDLGLGEDQPLTLMRLQAHVSQERYAALMADYQAALRQEIEQDVPDHAPPAANGQPVGATVDGPEPDAPAESASTNGATAPELSPEERLVWGRLSRRSMRCGLSPSVWTTLRELGDYAAAERVIAALESATPTTGEG